MLLSKTTTESGLPLLFLCAPQPALYIRYIDRDWQKNFYIYQQLRSFFFFSLFIAQYKISWWKLSCIYLCSKKVNTKPYFYLFLSFSFGHGTKKFEPYILFTKGKSIWSFPSLIQWPKDCTSILNWKSRMVTLSGTIKTMFWSFLDQSTLLKYKLELRFEWCAIFWPLYFELESLLDVFKLLKKWFTERLKTW